MRRQTTRAIRSARYQAVTPVCQVVAAGPVAMRTCPPEPITSPGLKAGQTVRLHSEYDSTHPADDVMGIMLMYIDP